MALQKDKSIEVIKLAESIKQQFYGSWPKLGTAVNSIVEKGDFEYISETKHHKHWYKVFSGELKYFPDWWSELEEILKLILESKGKSKSNNKHLSNLGNIDNGHKTGNVNYSVSKLQDSIIPFIYKGSYNLPLSKNVNFQLDYSWSKCLEKIITKDIDVALHNFPTVLAFTKRIKGQKNMFFFPFFTFSGYGICIKRNIIPESAINQTSNSAHGFEELSLEKKRTFLETSKIVLERSTDLEWVFTKFCEKFQCDLKLVRANILDHEIDKGKVKFIKDSSIGIYCTNTIHIADLKNNPDVEIIEQFSGHHNYNGIMCTMEYFSKNTQIVHGLISIWFNNIRLFQRDLRLVSNSKDTNEFASFHISALLEKLNKITSSNVSLDAFVQSYENNHFFTSASNASESFIENVLNNEDILMDNIEIADIQNNRTTLNIDGITDEIKEQIAFLKEQIELIVKEK